MSDRVPGRNEIADYVAMMWALGRTVDQIATATKLTTQQVQSIISGDKNATTSPAGH
jgi:predicted transcriptional regulator